MVHIGSTASYKPAPSQFAYCVAKAGVKMVSDFAAAELIEYGIRSNAVAPMGAVTAGSSWAPSAPLPIVVNLLPLLPDSRTAVAFSFTASGGSFQIDDVYVDPYRSH